MIQSLRQFPQFPFCGEFYFSSTCSILLRNIVKLANNTDNDETHPGLRILDALRILVAGNSIRGPFSKVQLYVFIDRCVLLLVLFHVSFSFSLCKCTRNHNGKYNWLCHVFSKQWARLFLELTLRFSKGFCWHLLHSRKQDSLDQFCF